MKKLLASLLVLAMCAPALAVVDFTAANNGDGTFTLKINTNGDVVRGLALKVTCTGGAALDLTGWASVNSTFNTYVDYAFATGASYTIPSGHPFADDAAAGVALQGDAIFSICMGVLDQAGAQAGFSSTVATDLVKVKVGIGHVVIAGDTLRGPESGVVGDTALTSTMPAGLDVTAGPTTYNLTTATTYGGTVLPATGPQPANQNATLTATGVTSPYQFFFWKWTGATVANPNASPTTIMMDADKAVTANFTLSCQEFNFTKLCNALTDNLVNASDVTAMITWVNANKTGSLFVVNATNPAWNAVGGTPAGPRGPKYNITKKQGGADTLVNASDLTAVITYVNNRKTGSLFVVNCGTCGC